MLMMPSYSALLPFPSSHNNSSFPSLPQYIQAPPSRALLSSRPLPPLALPSKAAGVPNKLVISELISTHDDASV